MGAKPVAAHLAGGDVLRGVKSRHLDVDRVKLVYGVVLEGQSKSVQTEHGGRSLPQVVVEVGENPLLGSAFSGKPRTEWPEADHVGVDVDESGQYEPALCVENPMGVHPVGKVSDPVKGGDQPVFGGDGSVLQEGTSVTGNDMPVHDIEPHSFLPGQHGSTLCPFGLYWYATAPGGSDREISPQVITREQKHPSYLRISHRVGHMEPDHWR